MLVRVAVTPLRGHVRVRGVLRVLRGVRVRAVHVPKGAHVGGVRRQRARYQEEEVAARGVRGRVGGGRRAVPVPDFTHVHILRWHPWHPLWHAHGHLLRLYDAPPGRVHCSPATRARERR